MLDSSDELPQCCMMWAMHSIIAARHCTCFMFHFAAELYSQGICGHPVQIQGMIDRGSAQCDTTGLRILSLAGRHMRAAADGCPKQLPDFKPRLLQLCSTGSAAEAKAATRSAGICCFACRASMLPVLGRSKAGPKTADPLLTSPRSATSATLCQSFCQFDQRPRAVAVVQSCLLGMRERLGQGCGRCSWSLHCSAETVTAPSDRPYVCWQSTLQRPAT